MGKWLLVMAVALVTAGAAHGQHVYLIGPDRYGMQENDTYTITWSADPGIKSVAVLATGERTPLGKQSRGDFDIVISDPVPADQGQVEWKVPWIDSISFFVKLKGFDDSGQMVTTTAREYGFRPAVLWGKTQDGIYLDLHNKTHQRLYVQKDYKITKGYLSSSSEGYDWVPPNVHPRHKHDHAGVFRVLSKERNHYSRLFDVNMPWAMRYVGGHFIHATSPNLYKYLGTHASHGCNRLTRTDARELFRATPIGTRVEVIGPSGS